MINPYPAVSGLEEAGIEVYSIKGRAYIRVEDHNAQMERFALIGEPLQDLIPEFAVLLGKEGYRGPKNSIPADVMARLLKKLALDKKREAQKLAFNKKTRAEQVQYLFEKLQG